jgi:hypothetical protein
MGWLTEKYIKNKSKKEWINIFLNLVWIGVFLSLFLQIYEVEQQNADCSMSFLNNPYGYRILNDTCPAYCCSYLEQTCNNPERKQELDEWYEKSLGISDSRIMEK